MILYTDGGCKGNWQPNHLIRELVAVVSDEHGQIVSETYKTGGSNNIAELIAVRDALEYAHQQGASAVEIRTDSRNNFGWVYRKALGKKLNDRGAVEALRLDIRRLRESVALELVWVPRKENLAGLYLDRR